jgi:small subunit ribosomal protein S20
MPQLKNAKKALRQSERRAFRNQDVKVNIKYLTKQTRKLAEAKDAKAEESLKATIKAIDKAAQKGVMKKNTAARKKTRLIKFMRTVEKQAAK